MRVFISYGRNDAADAAISLSNWLRIQGHEPWLDTENGIPIGSAFDMRIEMGITKSDLLIALLSPWSLRPEGFCRNEILYAQAMGIPIIPIRLADVVPPIQIISLNFIDAWQGIEGALEKLPALISEAALTRPNQSCERSHNSEKPWWASHQPIDFNEELSRHGGTFYGREWLFKEIRSWVNNPDSRLMLLTADAGVGKSAIAAQMTARFNVRGVHFCTRSNIESCRPKAWLSGLMCQLSLQFKTYRSNIACMEAPNWNDPTESLFRALIVDPLRDCHKEASDGEPWIFVIDSLDESLASAGEGLKDLLVGSVERIPHWLRLLVTSRPDRRIIASFKITSTSILNLAADDDQNRTDLLLYISESLAQITTAKSVSYPPFTATQLAEVADGNFLFAKMTLEALICPDPKARLNFDEIGKVPANLNGLYHSMFRKRFCDIQRYAHEVLPLLDCLISSKEPLPERILIKAAGPDEHTALRGLIDLSQFLVRHNDCIKIFHQSLADWLIASDRSSEFVASPKTGHQRLADAGWNEYQSSSIVLSPYTLAHLPVHLAEADRWQNLLELLNDPKFRLFTRWIEGGEGDTGIACLLGSIGFLERQRKQPVTSAGLATQLARIYIIQGRYNEAEVWLQHALKRSSWRRGRRIRSIALHELGSLNLYRGRCRRAELCYRQALLMCRLGIPVYQDEAAANLVGLATVFQSRYRFRKSIRLAARAIGEAKRSGDILHIIAGERLMAVGRKSLGDYVKSESHIRSGIKLSQAHKAHLETARLLLLNGHLLYDLATLAEAWPEKAEELFSEARSVAEEHHHQYCIFEANIALCRCALAMGATQKALHLLESQNHSSIGREHAYLQSIFQLGLAGVAHQQADFRKASSIYRSVFRYSAEQDLRSSCIRANVGIGSIEFHAGRHEEAIVAWNNALQMAIRVSKAWHSISEHSITLCQKLPLTVPR